MKNGPWRTIQLGCAAWVFLFQACSSPQEGGSFSALTYNVSGLLQGISLTNSERNIPLIAPLLNHHDLVLVQEDFHYHERLAGASDHPYRSHPKRPEKLVNDGLNRFSRSPFGELMRRSWSDCNGYFDSWHDCLSEKGFSFAEHWLSSSASLHVYNLHMDAGRSPEDYRARVGQIEQLMHAIERHSPGRALIVAGDTNLSLFSEVDDRGLLERLTREASLTDACHAVDCGLEHYDRLLFRSSDTLLLEVTSWMIDERFVDEQGQDLSDHKAIAARFTWEFNGQ